MTNSLRSTTTAARDTPLTRAMAQQVPRSQLPTGRFDSRFQMEPLFLRRAITSVLTTLDIRWRLTPPETEPRQREMLRTRQTFPTTPASRFFQQPRPRTFH